MPNEQTPNDTHASAAQICDMALKAMGLGAERAVDYRDGYDFMVEGKVRVACRYAMPTSDRQQVYTKRNGDVSTYSYKRWTFNFHRHGRIPDRYCDYFVCFLVGPEAAAGASSEVSVFVIPWGAITGLTFCSSVREGGSRGYRGKYSVYQDAWHLIERAARGRDAVLTSGRKKLRVSTDSRRRLRLILSSCDGLRPEFTAVVPNIGQRRGRRVIGAASAPSVLAGATDQIDDRVIGSDGREGDGSGDGDGKGPRRAATSTTGPRAASNVKPLRPPKRAAQVIRLPVE